MDAALNNTVCGSESSVEKQFLFRVKRENHSITADKAPANNHEAAVMDVQFSALGDCARSAIPIPGDISLS